jgi:uncharacterized lipoprotein YmbA
MTRRAAIVTVVLLAGCSFFSKSKPKLYSIEPVPGTAVTAARGTPIAIGSLELPPDLDRREIAVRKADQQLEVRPSELWGATLQALVLHALAFDLASRLPEGMIVLPGAAQTATAPRSIDVIIGDFAAGPEQRVMLDARWMMGGVTHHEQIAVEVSSLDSAQIATGMSQALSQLADRITSSLRSSP